MLIASILVAGFFLLHYYIYLDNGELPLIQSYTDSPVDTNRLTLCDEEQPSYFHPLRKVTYIYCLKDSDVLLAEQPESIFTAQMEPLPEDLLRYWEGEEKEGKMFMRDKIGKTYANLIFFIVQYIIVAGFIFLLFIFISKKGK